MHVELQKGTFM